MLLEESALEVVYSDDIIVNCSHNIHPLRLVYPIPYCLGRVGVHHHEHGPCFVKIQLAQCHNVVIIQSQTQEKPSQCPAQAYVHVNRAKGRASLAHLALRTEDACTCDYHTTLLK